MLPVDTSCAPEWLSQDARLNRLADSVIELGLGSTEQAAAVAAQASHLAWRSAGVPPSNWQSCACSLLGMPTAWQQLPIAVSHPCLPHSCAE